MPRLRSATLGLVVLAAAGCRHAAPPAPLPQDWSSLVTAPPPFAALYRLSCCGRSGLVLAARGDGRVLSVTVAAPPGGTVLAAWVDADGGWIERAKEGCRERLPGGVVPLSRKASLPLDPGVTSVLLSGVLPRGARALPGRPGWVEATTAGFWWRARVEGPPPRWTKVLIGRAGEAAALVTATRRDNDPLPHDLTLAAGAIEARLTLEAWRQADPPASPAWVSWPVCTDGP